MDPNHEAKLNFENYKNVKQNEKEGYKYNKCQDFDQNENKPKPMAKQIFKIEKVEYRPNMFSKND